MPFMNCVIYAKCSEKANYAECRYAQCCGAFTDALNSKKCCGHLDKSPGAKTSFLKRRIKLDVTSPRDVIVTFVVRQFNLFEER